MKYRSTLLALLLCALAFGLLAPSALAAPTVIPVTPQQLTNPTTGAPIGMLTGVQITRVTATANGLVASGVAVVQTATGTILASFTNAPLAASGSCPILHLTLGPINLNLLGLQVTTNQIVLDITAVPGPGNLLGNLLCDVANLLNQSPLNLQGIANLLTQLLNSL